MVPSIRSRRVFSNGGAHLSVAYDLSCFITYVDSIVPSIRSRRVVSNDGFLLSVAYDLSCLMMCFGFENTCLKTT